MDELNPRSKVYELKKQRKEELETRNPLKGEELMEFATLENELSKFEYQRHELHKQYETHLKMEEKERRIVEEENKKSNWSLGGLFDELIDKNEDKMKKVSFLSQILAIRLEDERELDDNINELAGESNFFRLAMARNMLERGCLDNNMMRKVELEQRIDDIGMKIGQEKTLVDGMNYKIQVLNDDIVRNVNKETKTEANTKFIAHQRCYY